jgi:predicted signal transduction protein with EAL and GGDEF domain
MGYVHSEIVGRRLVEFDFWVNPAQNWERAELIRQIGAYRDFEIRLFRKDGTTLWGLESSALFELDGESCVLFITRDITSIRAAEDKIKSLSFYDPLTKLPNCRLLLERLRKTRVVSSRVRRKEAILLIGLDRFKKVNDMLVPCNTYIFG